MTRQLVLVHGRGQQRKDARAIKREWLDALGEGLAKSGLTLPVAEEDVRFPFYGDTLDDLVSGSDDVADVIVRGQPSDDDERRFIRAVLEEVRTVAGISEAELVEVAGEEVLERGPLNWSWVQAILQVIDRHVPYGSATSIALATRDVYHYLTNSAASRAIDEGVAAALSPEKEAVVVAHSLGSVVAYQVLRTFGGERGWTVPLFMTVGSPLGVEQIRRYVRRTGPARVPECVTRWENVMDERDVVALYPLTADHFPLDPADPAVVNRTDLSNRTPNRHGIGGYLDDAGVARAIHDALVG